MPIRFYLSIFAILLFCSCSIVRPKVSEELKISPLVMSNFPNSSPKDFIRCDKVLDLEKLYKKAYACALKEHNEISTVNKDELPLCIVVSEKSKDIMTDKKGINYLEIVDVYLSIDPETHLFQVQIQRSPAVGLFISEENTMLLIENSDLDRIYSHELLHWLLFKANITEGDHTDTIWKTCSTQQYKPSKMANIVNWFKRLANLF